MFLTQINGLSPNLSELTLLLKLSENLRFSDYSMEIKDNLFTQINLIIEAKFGNSS